MAWGSFSPPARVMPAPPRREDGDATTAAYEEATLTAVGGDDVFQGCFRDEII